MFTFKVIMSDGATEVFSGNRYTTRPTTASSSLEVNIDDGEKFLYVSTAPSADGLPNHAEIDVIYIVNDSGKTIDTIGRRTS